MQDILDRLKSTNRWVLIGAAVVLIAIIALIAASASGAQQAAQAKPETAKAFTGDLTGTIVASGQLVAKKDVNLAMGTPGIVKKVTVAVGDTVKTGDLLVQLDDDITRNNLDKASLAVQAAQVKVDSSQHDLDNKVGWTPNQNQLNAATALLANSEAAVQAAQSDYDQVQWLPWVSSTPQSLALQQATNNYNKAKADMAYLYSNSPDVIFARDALQAAQLSLSTAQVDLKTAQVTLAKMSAAPFDGTVTVVNVEEGEAASGPVIELATMNDLEVLLDVDEVDVGAMAVDQPAVVTFDAWPGSPVTGKVLTIAPKANPSAGVVNFEVHVTLDKTDLGLRSGMTAKATIQTFALKNVLLVSNHAIAVDRETGKSYVMLITPQGQTRTEVSVGVHNDEYTQIVSGLKEGDEVQSSPLAQ